MCGEIVEQGNGRVASAASIWGQPAHNDTILCRKDVYNNICMYACMLICMYEYMDVCMLCD